MSVPGIHEDNADGVHFWTMRTPLHCKGILMTQTLISHRLQLPMEESCGEESADAFFSQIRQLDYLLSKVNYLLLINI